MSGVHYIKGHEVWVLSDTPIVGPTPTERIVATSSTLGLLHNPMVSRWLFGVDLVVPPSSVRQIISAGTAHASDLQLKPINLNSQLIQVNSPLSPAPFDTIQYPSLTYGTFLIRATLFIRSDAAAAPTFPANNTSGSIALTLTLTDNLGTTFPVTPYDRPIFKFAGDVQNESFVYNLMVPYNAARTSVSIHLAITNRCTGADNNLTILAAGSYIETTVIQ